MNMDKINIELWDSKGYIDMLNELGTIPRQGEIITIKKFAGMGVKKTTYRVNAVEYDITKGNTFVDVKIHVEEY